MSGEERERAVIVLALVCLLLTLITSNATCAEEQAPEIEWTRQFGTYRYDHAGGVAVGPQGEIYVSGGTEGPLPGQTYAGRADAFLRKYDPDGNEVWTRQFGTSSHDHAMGVAVGPQGEVYVAGRTNGTLPGQTYAGMIDAFLRKYDPDGNEVWTRQFGTSSHDLARGVAVGPQGEIYVTGRARGSLPGQTYAGEVGAFLRKYDPDGNEVWTHQFGISKWDEANAVAVGPQGKVYVTGKMFFALPGQTYEGVIDVFLRKYDPDGNEVWTHQFADENEPWTYQFGSSSFEYARGVAVGPRGEAYVAGWKSGRSWNERDALIVKFAAQILAFPPEVNIVEPNGGDVVCDKVRITAEVSDADDDPLTVSFLINDIVIHTVELTDTVIAQNVPYSWDTFPSYEDGSYEVSVTASDSISTASDSIGVVLKNRFTVAGEIVAYVAGPTPDLPIAGASLQLILDGEVQYSFVTDENGRYSFENVEPNLPGKRYNRIVLKNDVVLDIRNADRTVHYNPGVDELEEVIRIKNYAVAGGSPIDLHVYDTEGRHTGLIDGEIELGIPLSWYSGDTEPEVIVILNPAYVYDLVVFGEESGTFDLQVSSYILIDSEDTIVTINLNDVSIATGDEMLVTYDFAEIEEEINILLNEGYSIEDAVEDVVNSIDSDGDGLVDGKEIEIGTNPLNVDSDGDMWNDAADMSPTNAIIPNVFIAGVIAAVVVAIFLLLRARKP